MTNAGEFSGQTSRIKSNVKTKDNQIPTLSGTSKDHKKAEDPIAGPDNRPIMGATVGPNVGLSTFGSIIVRKVADAHDVGHVSKSTEETIAKLEEYNERRKDLDVNDVRKLSKVVVGSMDIDKWYPSTIPAPSAKEVGNMYVDSNVEIATINYDKVSKYLGEHLTEKEIKDEGMEEIVYIKVKKTKNNISKKKGNKNTVQEKIDVGAHEKEHGKNNITSDEENRKLAQKAADDDVSKTETDSISMTKINVGDHEKEHGINNVISAVDAENPKEAQHKVNNDVPNNITKSNIDAHDKEHDISNVTSAVKDDKHIKAHKTAKEREEDKFLVPKRKPTLEEERRMVGKALAILIKTGMENHIYRFNNEIRIQKTGGPIGLALTGEVADCYMLNWDKKYLKKLKSLNMNPLVYSRLKDDILIAIVSLEKGTTYINGELVVDEEKSKEDENKSDAEVTMEVLKTIAESVDSMLKFTYDTPCKHSDGKMPVLDLKVNINAEMQNQIEYEFYEKPTKNPRVILADSAMNFSAKRTILTQECIRRLRNTKIELGEDIRNKHMNNLMVKIKNSGYDSKFRKEIVDSSLKAFSKMIEENKNGTKPLFRNRAWKKEEREENKKNQKLNWYRNKKKTKIDYTSILFVPPTPGGILIKEMKQREDEINKNEKERIKFVEKSGDNIETLLVKKNPFKKEKCSQKMCPICKNRTEDVKILCNTNNVGYKWTCNMCKEQNKVRVYEGESSRSARLRGFEHMAAYRNKQLNSVLYKHKLTEHTEHEEVDFTMEITGVFKDPLSRQADEAVRIYNRKNSELMNSKSEFNHPPVARIIVKKNDFNNHGGKVSHGL